MKELGEKLFEIHGTTYTAFAYNGLFEEIQKLNLKFQFVSIDAPYGTEKKGLNLADILDFIPDYIDSSFVIVLDDAQRRGEMKMISE